MSTFLLRFEGADHQVGVFESAWEGVKWVFLRCEGFFAAEGGRDRSNPYLYTEDKQEELTLVLTDLLINAAQENSEQAFGGGRNEPENYD